MSPGSSSSSKPPARPARAWLARRGPAAAVWPGWSRPGRGAIPRPAPARRPRCCTSPGRPLHGKGGGGRGCQLTRVLPSTPGVQSAPPAWWRAGRPGTPLAERSVSVRHGERRGVMTRHVRPATTKTNPGNEQSPGLPHPPKPTRMLAAHNRQGDTWRVDPGLWEDRAVP